MRDLRRNWNWAIRATSTGRISVSSTLLLVAVPHTLIESGPDEFNLPEYVMEMTAPYEIERAHHRYEDYGLCDNALCTKCSSLRRGDLPTFDETCLGVYHQLYIGGRYAHLLHARLCTSEDLRVPPFSNESAPWLYLTQAQDAPAALLRERGWLLTPDHKLFRGTYRLMFSVAPFDPRWYYVICEAQT